MAKDDSFSPDILRQSWPSFLSLLAENPERAKREFYRFAWKVLIAFPPPAMRGLSREDREDAISEVVFHCLKDDLRVLRTYRDQGHPFASWFLVVAQYRTLDLLRRCAHSAGTTRSDDSGTLHHDHSPEGRPDESAFSRRNLDLVMRFVLQMDLTDQILLMASAEGYRPRDLVRLLGLPSRNAKKVSDDLRYCRKRLKILLQTRAGLDWRDPIGDEVGSTKM